MSTPQKPRKKFVLRIPLRRKKRNLKPVSTQNKDSPVVSPPNCKTEATTPTKPQSLTSPGSDAAATSSPSSVITADVDQQGECGSPQSTQVDVPTTDTNDRETRRKLTLRQHMQDDDIYTDEEETDARRAAEHKESENRHDSGGMSSESDTERKEEANENEELDALRVVDREYEMLMQDTMTMTMMHNNNHHNHKESLPSTTTLDEPDWVRTEKQALAIKHAAMRETCQHSMTMFIDHALDNAQFKFITGNVETLLAINGENGDDANDANGDDDNISQTSPMRAVVDDRKHLLHSMQSLSLSQLFNDCTSAQMTAIMHEFDTFVAGQHIEVDEEHNTVTFGADAYQQQCHALRNKFEACPILYVLLAQKYIEFEQVCALDLPQICLLCVNAVIRKKVQRKFESLVKKANAKRVEDALFAHWQQNRVHFLQQKQNTSDVSSQSSHSPNESNMNSKQEMDVDDVDDTKQKIENEIENENEHKIENKNEDDITQVLANDVLDNNGENVTSSNSSIETPNEAETDAPAEAQPEVEATADPDSVSATATTPESDSHVLHDQYPLFCKQYIRFLQSFPKYRNGIVSGHVAIEKIFAFDQQHLLQPPSLSPAENDESAVAVATHTPNLNHRKRKHVDVIDITSSSSSSPKKRKLVIDVDADHAKERVIWSGVLVNSGESVQCHVGMKQIGGKSIWMLPFKRKKKRAHDSSVNNNNLVITGRISLSSIIKFIKQLRKHKSRRILFAEIESTQYTQPNAYHTLASQLRVGGKAGVIDFEKEGILIYVLSSAFLSPSHSISRELLKYFDGHKAKMPKSQIFAIIIITHGVYSRVKRKVSKPSTSRVKPCKPAQPPLPTASSNSDTDSTNVTMPTMKGNDDADAVWDQIHHEIDAERDAYEEHDERESLGELPPPLPPHLLAEREQFRLQKLASHHVHPHMHTHVHSPNVAMPTSIPGPVSMYNPAAGLPQPPLPHVNGAPLMPLPHAHNTYAPRPMPPPLPVSDGHAYFGYAPRPLPPPLPVPQEQTFVIRPQLIMNGMNAHPMHPPHFGYPPRPPQPPLPR